MLSFDTIAARAPAPSTASSFAGARIHSSTSRRRARVSARSQVTVRNDNALIVNTKGGGHCFLGLYLAKKLVADGHKVTILNDGDESKLSGKAPFNQYPSSGATVVWGKPEDPSTYPAGDFDVVYDNNGKDMDACKALIDTYASKVKHYVFVGSAGAYVADDVEPMHVEGDARKPSAGHVAVENYLVEVDAPFTVFQPQYIYGAYTAKDCEQFFMDRILRDRPVPIPAPGIQLTSLSNVEDLANMMALVPGNKDAIGQHFNMTGDRCITLDGIAKAIGKAAGKDVRIVHYDPTSEAVKQSGYKFPFRAVHFFSSVDKAKRVLGWKPEHTFVGDLDDRLAEFEASGRLDEDVDFSADDEVIRA
jgi:nucleoside-diphosphate-sugar epimerase